MTTIPKQETQYEVKGYASIETLRSAVNKYLESRGLQDNINIHYLISVTEEGRFIPVFHGRESFELRIFSKFPCVN